MALTKVKLCKMMIYLIIGIFLAGTAVGTAGIAEASLTTQVFSGIGGTGPVTVILTAAPRISADSCAHGPYNSAMGFIGHECQETEQRGTLPYVTATMATANTLSTVSHVSTTFSSSYIISTTTLPPSTVTKTISEVVTFSPVILSMTVTAMCNWPEQEIITPCTTVVLATAGTTPVPTTSKSAAIPSANNPLKSFTSLVKRGYDNTVTFLKGLSGYSFAGGNHGNVEGPGEQLHGLQRRQLNFCRLPGLITPLVMTCLATIGAIALFAVFDPKRNPRMTGFCTAMYVIVFIVAYVVFIYNEYHVASVVPAWKTCVEAYEVLLANLTAQAEACKPGLL